MLLHYDDPSLRDLYFLDPQWLCDMLAHIVTVKQVHSYIKNGKTACHMTHDKRTYAVPSLAYFVRFRHTNLRGNAISTVMDPDQDPASRLVGGCERVSEQHRFPD